MTWPVFGSLRGDLVAGLTVWAVLVPEALAYATIAGVSPVIGLYAAPGRCCCTPPSAAPGIWSRAAPGPAGVGVDG